MGTLQSIRGKLLAAIMVAVVLVLGALGLSLTGMERVKNQFINFIDHEQARIQAVDAMHADGLLAGLAISHKVLNPALAGRRAIVKTTTDSFDTHLAHAQRLSVGEPVILRQLQAIEAAWKDNKASKFKALDLADAGQVEEASRFLSAVEQPSWQQIRQKLQGLGEQLEQQRQSLRHTVVDDADTTLRNGILLGLIAVIIGSALTLAVMASLSRGLNRTIRAMQDIADGEGDLTARLDASGKDEIAGLATAFNHFAEKVQSSVRQVADSTRQLTRAAEEMSASSDETDRQAHQQQAATDQVAAAMNEMTSTVQEVSRHAITAAASARSADHEASGGQQVVQHTIKTIHELANEVEQAAAVINKLEENTDSIGTVLDVIRGIAEQTNLLALNAAIEAARAGEQGRGFAVVADEVRILAGRTQQSTQEIQGMIQRLQAGAREAVQAMEESRNRAQATVDQAAQAGSSLKAITDAVGSIHEMNSQIARAAEEQSTVADEINRSLANISQVSDGTVEGARHTSDASRQLAQLAVELRKVVEQFKV